MHDSGEFAWDCDGAPEAAWQLFLRHGDVAYALARLLSADEAQAADVIEGTFVQLGRTGAALLDDRDGCLEVLTSVCQRLGAPSGDPCLSLVVRILAGATESEVAHASSAAAGGDGRSLAAAAV